MMGGFGFGGIGMLLWIVVIVAAVYWITQTVTGQRVREAPPLKADARTPREVLDDRLARGEITIEQYHDLRKALV